MRGVPEGLTIAEANPREDACHCEKVVYEATAGCLDKVDIQALNIKSVGGKSF